MTEFIDLNHPEFAIKQVYLNLMPSETSFCVCCLEKGVTFYNLARCKHVDFLIKYCDLNVKHFQNIICLKCHNFLKTIECFRQQVRDSTSQLNSQIHIFTPKATFSNLQLSNTEISFTINNQPIASEINSPFETLANQEPVSEHNNFKTEVKIEHDSSDFETEDVPLSQIKNKKRQRKTENISKKRNSGKEKRLQKIIEQYNGKIKIVTLDIQELMSERDRDRAKDAYIRLPYKCDDCIVGFDHELILKEHLQNRHKKTRGSLVCDICKSVLKTEQSFRQHCKRHLMRYECEECGRRNNTLQPLVTHFNETHGTIPTRTYACRECEFSTTSHRKYRYHKDKHREKEQCTECGKTFVTKTSLKLHMFTIHKQSSRVYACSLCDKTYSGKSGLTGHVSAAHAPSVAYCQSCAQPFKSRASLQHHLNTHSAHVNSDDYKFVCDHCENKFLTKAALHEHIDWVHLHKTKYECNVCGKAFKNSSALKKHKDFVHEKKRPPRNKICDHCGRAFTSLCILRAHVRTHTGERPLRCARCPRAFAHPAALHTHCKLLHAGAGHNDTDTNGRGNIE